MWKCVALKLTWSRVHKLLGLAETCEETHDSLSFE